MLASVLVECEELGANISQETAAGERQRSSGMPAGSLIDSLVRFSSSNRSTEVKEDPVDQESSKSTKGLKLRVPIDILEVVAVEVSRCGTH